MSLELDLLTFIHSTRVISPRILAYFWDPGNYRLWAQVMLEGRERFVPFDLKVI